jgi:hypothetical protein
MCAERQDLGLGNGLPRRANAAADLVDGNIIATPRITVVERKGALREGLECRRRSQRAIAMNRRFG